MNLDFSSLFKYLMAASIAVMSVSTLSKPNRPLVPSRLQAVLKGDHVEKKNIFISQTESREIKKEHNFIVAPGLYRGFIVFKNEQVTGYGVLLIDRVRTKDMATLFMMDAQKKVRRIEVLAFYEPPEYKPGIEWLSSIVEKKAHQVDGITGATLSANSIKKGMRTSLALSSFLSED